MNIIEKMMTQKLAGMVLTPEWVASDMIDMLPDEIWNKDSTFLDPACKSGVFLRLIYNRLMDKLQDDFPNADERREHILKNQIFGVAINDAAKLVSQRMLYSNLPAEGDINNIVVIDSYTNIIKRPLVEYMNSLEKEFNKVRFDVVIGNPPYNKGMDLDFVYKGFQLCTQYTVMITPAKWQTAADNYSGCASKTIDYKGFRKKLVPHMSKVVFYPDCGDVFKISQVDGIVYYLMDKNIHETSIVENKCVKQRHFNSITNRSINERQSLLNIGDEIVRYITSKQKFRFKHNIPGKKYEVWTNTQISKGQSLDGGKISLILSKNGDSLVVGESRILDTSKGEKSPSGASECTFSSDSESECESFVSWLNTKFTRFFVAINISKLTGILTDDCFRFVPAPPSGKFDHIYTDQELYKAFNLPQKYIDVIEAVIKERK